jgi:signal transduction histidine kinase
MPRFKDDVCPNDIVLDVCDLFEDRLTKEGISLRTELCEPPRRGTFDPEGLHNMLCNLVANAVDACRFDPSDTKNGHTITLRCRSNGENATILEVEDDGSGIPDEMNNRVFEDFFSTKGSEGTGIGLLVVQKVAEEHGGTITFTSRPGEGTIFTATLPTSMRPPVLVSTGESQG